MSAPALLPLVADLCRNSALRQRLNQNSYLVFQEYGLEPHDICCFHTMDPDRIGACIANELEEYFNNLPSGEWPPSTEHHFPLPASGQSEYPDPRPKLFRFEPTNIDKATAGNQVELVVYGQSFAQDHTTVELVPQQGKPLAGTASTFGTFRSSGVRALFSTSDLNAESYAVQVTLCRGGTHEQVLDSLDVKLVVED